MAKEVKEFDLAHDRYAVKFGLVLGLYRTFAALVSFWAVNRSGPLEDPTKDQVIRVNINHGLDNTAVLDDLLFKLTQRVFDRFAGNYKSKDTTLAIEWIGDVVACDNWVKSLH